MYGHHKTNVKKRKYNYLAQVRKLHITLNMMNKEVMAMRYTNATSRDSILACSMLEGMGNKCNILSLRADAFYDATSVYKICKKLNIKPIIRPIKNARVYEKVDCLSERNNNVKGIQSCKNYENGIKSGKRR